MYNYQEVIDKIENSRRFGNLPGVEVTKRMLATLGNPQEGLAFIHVAGTNGKGSTCAFLTNILTKAGLKCGCFTSPHLIHFEERITVDQKMIPKDAVTRLGNELLSIDFGVTPTMFDYCLVMAVLYFKECGCDVAVMETGLGGRLDSTNALGNPMVAVITRIGYDHMAILGNTLTKIASEKAGILKENVPAIFAPQEEEALAVLRKHPGTLVSSEDMEKVASMKPGLMGAYQLENGAAAMLAAQIYFAKIGLDEKKALEAIQRGIHTAVWKGRMEVLSEEPYLMVDGAHNSNGIHALKTSLMKLYPDEKFHFVMGVMADKDYEKMIEELLPLAIDFVTVTPESSRALQAESLAEKIRSQEIPARSIASVADVLTLPRVGEKTIALGSLYFIGELEAIYYGDT
ncbi:MAG: bifunctional folylpolyglutamate synthase/dihydrofolate synthase [Lachnobacterium sp.]|nr:bifunctional folylpolyglutamate synthase/dihydrofolate synthase [Lachnobacterium sp.]